MKTKTFNRPEV